MPASAAGSSYIGICSGDIGWSSGVTSLPKTEGVFGWICMAGTSDAEWPGMPLGGPLRADTADSPP